MGTKQIIYTIIATPIIIAEIWLALAFGTVWENKVRCENGAIEFCKGE